jgi:hypothetical protein
MSIYITQQKKEEFEAKIAELRKLMEYETIGGIISLNGTMDTYTYILSHAIVLPVEESWDGYFDATINSFIDDDPNASLQTRLKYKDGVIIKPKE